MYIHYTFIVFNVFLLLCGLVYPYKMADFSRDKFCVNLSGPMHYVLFEDKVEWNTAFKFCQDNAMELVKIMSSNDNNRFLTWLKTQNRNGTDIAFWIGVSRSRKQSGFTPFVYSSDKSRLVYENWHANEPNNTGSENNCVSLSKRNETCTHVTYKWSANNCCDKYIFFCQTECLHWDVDTNLKP